MNPSLPASSIPRVRFLRHRSSLTQRLVAWLTSVTLTGLLYLPVLPQIAEAADQQGTTIFLGKHYEIRPDGTTVKYIFAGDQRIAAVITSPTGARSIQYFHGDHLGSTNVVTDGTGQVVARMEYRPFGTTSHQEGTADVPHKFTGQRFEDSTGLYDYNARYYDVDLGRFIQPDPFIQDPSDPQTLNRYTYVRNNPVNLVDLSGNFWQFIVAAIIAIASTAAIVSITAGAASLTMSATGNERLAQRFAKISQIAAYISTPLMLTPENQLSTAAYFASGAAIAAASPIEPTAAAFSGPSFNTGYSPSPLQHTVGAVAGYGVSIAATALLLGATIAVVGAIAEDMAPMARPSLRRFAARFGPKLGKIRFDSRVGRFRDTATGEFIKSPGEFYPQGGKIALGRFGEYKQGLEALAVKEGARILDEPFPSGIHLHDALRAEIDAAERIGFRLKGVEPGTISHDVELPYIYSRPDLLKKTKFFQE